MKPRLGTLDRRLLRALTRHERGSAIRPPWYRAFTGKTSRWRWKQDLAGKAEVIWHILRFGQLNLQRGSVWSIRGYSPGEQALALHVLTHFGWKPHPPNVELGDGERRQNARAIEESQAWAERIGNEIKAGAETRSRPK